jgi:hypothetical protein
MDCLFHLSGYFQPQIYKSCVVEKSIIFGKQNNIDFVAQNTRLLSPVGKIVCTPPKFVVQEWQYI